MVSRSLRRPVGPLTAGRRYAQHMESKITQEALADLLRETGRRHHAAFIEAKAVDPEWAIWYAGYLQAHLWDRAGRLPTRSELVALLVRADREYTASDVDEPWPQYYARLILEALG